MWRATMDALAVRYYCVALDLPGHGGSAPMPHEWFTIPRMADLITDVSQHLGLENAVLVGHSMGGAIALEMALREAYRARGLLLINPVIAGPLLSMRGWLGEALVPPLVAAGRALWPVAMRLLGTARHGNRHERTNGKRRRREDLARTNIDSALGTLRAVARYDLRPRLGELRVPTLVLVGEHDSTVSPDQGRLVALSVDGARLEEMPCGHHPYDEIPLPYLKSIRAFLGPLEGIVA